MTELLLRWKVL